MEIRKEEQVGVCKRRKLFLDNLGTWEECVWKERARQALEDEQDTSNWGKRLQQEDKAGRVIGRKNGKKDNHVVFSIRIAWCKCRTCSLSAIFWACLSARWPDLVSYGSCLQRVLLQDTEGHSALWGFLVLLGCSLQQRQTSTQRSTLGNELYPLLLSLMTSSQPEIQVPIP